MKLFILYATPAKFHGIGLGESAKTHAEKTGNQEKSLKIAGHKESIDYRVFLEIKGSQNSHTMIEIRHFTMNPLQENTYLLINEKKGCFIIDPGCYFTNEQNELLDAFASGGLKPERLLNTHCHLDHIFGNGLINRQFGLKPWIHPLEQPVLDRSPQAGMMYNLPFESSPAPAGYLEDGEKILWDGAVLEVILTPGHSPGSVCFYLENQKLLLGGDVLFRDSIGRSDLPGGDFATLERSIRERLYVLPDEVTVYPGHGPVTTIGYEKTHNPFVRMEN